MYHHRSHSVIKLNRNILWLCISVDNLPLAFLKRQRVNKGVTDTIFLPEVWDRLEQPDTVG
jgi:hypothetical protein